MRLFMFDVRIIVQRSRLQFDDAIIAISNRAQHYTLLHCTVHQLAADVLYSTVATTAHNTH